MTIAVGDIIVNSLLKNNFDPNLKIIDFKSRRKYISNYFNDFFQKKIFIKIIQEQLILKLQKN